MNPTLLHIYGPIALHSYGAIIVIGILSTLFLAQRNTTLMSLVTFEKLMDIVTVIIVSVLFGARLLFALENNIDSFWQLLAVWQGGLSVLGGIIGASIFVPLYLYASGIPVLKTLDQLTIYIPLLHGISRIGCFFAGCCYGQSLFIHNTLSAALFAPPLLSSLLLLFIFAALYAQKDNNKKPGYLLGYYLYLGGMERLITDFLRYDYEPILLGLSQTQILALCIATIGVIIKGSASPKRGIS